MDSHVPIAQFQEYHVAAFIAAISLFFFYTYLTNNSLKYISSVFY